MQPTVFLEELDAFTYRDLIAEGRAVIVPLGSIEQHGPHMPLSTDVMLSKSVSAAVAMELDALVAAPLVYGYKSQQRSGGGNHLPGTTSLDATSVTGIIENLTREFARHGVRNLVFLNGHFENYQFAYEGIDLALRQLEAQGITDMKVLLLSYWDFVDESTIKRIYPEGFPGWDLEHGGVLETSLMMYLHPDLVQSERISDDEPAVLPRFDVFPVRPELTPASGCLSSAKQASAEKGRILIEAVTEQLVGDLKAELPKVRSRV